MIRIKLIGKKDGEVKSVVYGETEESTKLLIDTFITLYDLYVEEVRQSNFGIRLPD